STSTPTMICFASIPLSSMEVRTRSRSWVPMEEPSPVLQACPGILDYGPGGTIGNWRDLMSAAVVVRSMLGVSPPAYEEACSGMGPENAA
ncbi:replication initiation protein RepC, partial [Rhizobium ruizarguesonis]